MLNNVRLQAQPRVHPAEQHLVGRAQEVAGRLVLLDGDHAARRNLPCINCEHIANDGCNGRSLLSFQTDANNGRTVHAADHKNGMKISIERDHNMAGRSRVIEYFRIGGCLHADLAYVLTVDVCGTELFSRFTR